MSKKRAGGQDKLDEQTSAWQKTLGNFARTNKNPHNSIGKSKFALRSGEHHNIFSGEK